MYLLHENRSSNQISLRREVESLFIIVFALRFNSCHVVHCLISVKKQHFSRYSSNSEANASELLEYLENILHSNVSKHTVVF